VTSHLGLYNVYNKWTCTWGYKKPSLRQALPLLLYSVLSCIVSIQCTGIPSVMNNLLILNMHQDKTDLLDLEAVACDFVALNNYRKNLFGKGNLWSIRLMPRGVHAKHKHCLKSCIGQYKVNQQEGVHSLCSTAQMLWPSFGPPRPKHRVLAVRRTSGRSSYCQQKPWPQHSRSWTERRSMTPFLLSDFLEFRRCFASASEVTIAEQIYRVSVV